MFITSSDVKAGTAACRSGSIFIEIVPPVKIIAILFSLNIFSPPLLKTNNIIETLKNVQKNKYKVISTSLQTDKSIYDIEYKKLAIVIGNEANGVSEEVLKLSDAKIKIPMLGKTESLNISERHNLADCMISNGNGLWALLHCGYCGYVDTIYPIRINGEECTPEDCEKLMEEIDAVRNDRLLFQIGRAHV